MSVARSAQSSRLLNVAVRMLTLLVLALLSPSCTQKDTVPIGGAWELVWVTSPIPEAGGHHPFLWRHSRHVHVLVEGDTYAPKYVPDDCVLYVSLDSDHIGAACGDREPLVLNPDGDVFLEAHQQGYFDRDPLPVSDHEQIPISEILRRARLQPPLTNAWKMPMRSR